MKPPTHISKCCKGVKYEVHVGSPEDRDSYLW